MPLDTPRFFQDYAPVFARLAIWNRKFGPVLARLEKTQLQKVTASDEGFLTLSVYKPGDDRSAVVLSIRKGESGVTLSDVKPPSQPKPNAIVQVIRKYLAGRRVKYAYASLSPVALVIEFDLAPEETDKDIIDGPDTLILDLDAKPARVVVARKMTGVPTRYAHVAANFDADDDFFESFCEWSLDSTKTKRRACFDVPLLAYSIIPAQFEELKETAEAQALERLAAAQRKEALAPDSSKPMTLERALTLLPTHVRRAAKTRLQFLERRIIKQKADLPLEAEITRLTKRAEGLRANLYLWPTGSQVWYVPRELIEEFGLPAFMQLKQGQRPGDLLDEAFHQCDKLKRRREELSVRIAQSEKAHDVFVDLLTMAGREIEKAFEEFRAEAKGNSSMERQDWTVHLSKAQPEAALQLCQVLDIAWGEGEQKRNDAKEESGERLPYRSFTSSTGEFIRVARSATDSDAMLKLMPSHHTWVHVLTGEGSHVWLEKPKNHAPSSQAVREAAILALHYSKMSRGHAGDVRVATRADVEKKKDLPAGKVLVRRCDTMLVRYDDAELQHILASAQ